MKSTSALSQELIEILLKLARQQLEYEGKLLALLFFKFDDGRVVLIREELPEQHEERRRVIWRIGHHMRSRGENIQEAVMVVNSWFVAGRDGIDGLSTAPSQHPQRQAAIVASGRNAEDSRHSIVVQPYDVNDDNSLVWREPMIAHYDHPTDAKNRVSGLVDDLFIPQGVH
jgi:hypothetical protein